LVLLYNDFLARNVTFLIRRFIPLLKLASSPRGGTKKDHLKGGLFILGSTNRSGDAGVLDPDAAHSELMIAFRARSSALKQVTIQRGVGQTFFL